ncbi:hypothetical protein ACFHW2_41805 [Actinomadura sp. LOL_016]|uniref:hypothetical protein n=1 Tax=unclassified Actinomadura TaxID=2626254 RepID=UPI003A7F632C
MRLPLEDGATPERFEGVLLRFRGEMAASETYDLARYGEITVAAGGRLFQPTDGHDDSAQARNEARALLVDDASNVQNPATIPYTGDGRVVRLGDVTSGLTGVLSYGFGSYRLQPTGSPHRTAVTPVGEPRSSRDDVFDRPPLAQTFRPAAGGESFTAIVNHFKSKGCGGASGPDADQGDGQSCYNARRVRQAAAIAAMAAGTRNPLVLGDLNSYAAEDPIEMLEDAGLTSQTERFVDDEDRYSYVYMGLSGELDHMLAGPALSRRVTGATIWHVNADEPRFLDYNTEYNPAEFYRPDAFRSSDHDPLLVGLDLR